MESQNNSSKHLLSSDFPARLAAGINAAVNGNSNNVSSPLFIQQLQQLSEISTAAGGANTFITPNSQRNFTTADLAAAATTSWNTQTSAWFDQAKMAAMLPMYSAFQNSSSEQAAQNHVCSMVEDNFKDQAASTAAVVCAPNSFFSFQMQAPIQSHYSDERSASGGTYNAIAPTMPHESHQTKLDSPLYGLRSGRISSHRGNMPPASSLPASATSISSTESPIRAHTMTPHSNSYSTCNSSSHPPSNETVESPGNIQQQQHQIYSSNQTLDNTPSETSEMPHSNKSSVYGYSPASTKIHKAPTQNSFELKPNNTNLSDLSEQIEELGDANAVDELSELDLKDLREYLIDKEESFTNSALLFAKTVNSTELNLPSISNSTVVVPEVGRAEELANADKELDRLLSLARQNDVKFENVNSKLPPPPKFSFDMLKPLKLPTIPTSTKINNTVQFTPPDSPTNASTLIDFTKIKFAKTSPEKIAQKFPTSNCSLLPSTSKSAATFNGFKDGEMALKKKSSLATTKSAITFLPTTKNSPTLSLGGGPKSILERRKEHLKNKKVPIYKQKTNDLIVPINVKEEAKISTNLKNSKDVKKDDAYSFTDDEEDMAGNTALLGPAATPTSKPTNASSKIINKLGKLFSQSELKLEKNLNENSRNGGPMKRHSDISVFEKPPTPNRSISTTTTSAPLINAKVPTTLNSTTTTASVVVAVPTRTLPSLAEVIRERRMNRCGYVKCEYMTTDDSILPEMANVENHFTTQLQIDEENNTTAITPTCKIKHEELETLENPTSKLLPKLVIKLPKFHLNCIKEEDEGIQKLHKRTMSMESAGSQKHKKKKKKHKKHEKDCDWEVAVDFPSHKKKHKKHKKNRKEKRRYSFNELGTTNSSDLMERRYSMDQTNSVVFSKKRRLIGQWNDEAEEQQILKIHLSEESSEGNSECFGSATTSCAALKSGEDFVAARLNSFAKIQGEVAKGTFVVIKDDVFKPDCAIWKLDNQNLLQKYPPLNTHSEPIIYKNSSTYSIFERLHDYIIIDVRFLKHSRAENIIEPMVPINDLFPAVCYDIQGDYSIDFNKEIVEEECRQKNQDFRINILTNKDKLKLNLKKFTQAMLKHVISMDFFQHIKSSNDWNFLCALNEIENLNLEVLKKIQSRVKWTENRFEILQEYSNLTTINADLILPELCQFCEAADISKILQMFSSETLDDEILIIKNPESKEILPAIEYLVCTSCENNALNYHKIFHMRYNIFKKCEDKLEFLSLESKNFENNLSNDLLVENCLKKIGWVNSIYNEYLEIWRKFQVGDC